MIKTNRRSIGGDRGILEELRDSLSVPNELVDYPARSRLYVETVSGTRDDDVIDEFLRLHAEELDAACHVELQASPEELATEPLFGNCACDWIEDDERIFDDPPYTERDACPSCGKGSAELSASLRGKLKKLRSMADLIRLPPALFIGSVKLVGLIEQEQWTGVETAPIIDADTNKPSKDHYQLVITSVLPPVHPSRAPVRSPTPDFCERCRKLGYQSPERQPFYGRSVLDVAGDWNVSVEWTALHYVSCPDLICSRRVVHALMKLDRHQRWIPVKLLDE